MALAALCILLVYPVLWMEFPSGRSAETFSHGAINGIVLYRNCLKEGLAFDLPFIHALSHQKEKNPVHKSIYFTSIH